MAVESAAGCPRDPAALKQHVMDELSRHPFVPAWWLPGPHAQSIWPSLFRSRRLAPHARRLRLKLPDGDFLDTYIQNGRPDAPTVVMLHGLEGSFHSRYITGMRRALAAMGWNAVAMEHRSCGRDINLACRMYHMGETGDLSFLVRWLVEQASVKRLYLVGYSLGGNVLAKWLGESGHNLPEEVAGAATVSTPYDLVLSGPYMDRPLMRPYRIKFLRTLRKKAMLKDRQYPGIINLHGVRQCTTFEQFDTFATAPLHGFKDAADYWAQVGCGQVLEHVRRPLLLVSAADDPFVQGHTFPRQCAAASPYLYPLQTPNGGHVGFVWGSPLRPRFWAEEQVLRFFLALDRPSR